MLMFLSFFLVNSLANEFEVAQYSCSVVQVRKQGMTEVKAGGCRSNIVFSKLGTEVM